MREKTKKSIRSSLTEDLSFWSKIFHRVGTRAPALIILSGECDEADELMVRFLPLLQMEQQYDCIVLVAVSESILESAKEESCIDVEIQRCTEEQMDEICRIQLLDVFYHNLPIYIDRFKGREDADGNQLIGSYGLTMRDIVARVCLRLSHTPTENEEESWIRKKDKHRQRRIRQIDWEEVSHWIPTGGAYYSSIEQRVHERLLDIQSKGGILPESRIVIQGDTKTARACLREWISAQVVGITDQDEQKWGEYRSTVKVIEPVKAYEPYDPLLRILITNSRFRSICKELYSIGYQVGRQVFLLNDSPMLPELLDEDRIRDLEHIVEESHEVYQEFRNKYPIQMILLSPWSASGDIYICAMYLPDYLREQHITDFVIVVTSSLAQRVALLCGFETVLISESEALLLMDYARWVGFEESGIRNLNVFVKGNHRINTLEREVDWNTFHQRLVFQSPVRKTRPRFKQMDAGHWFEEYGLNKGRTVLIAPYSQSMGEIPSDITRPLVQRLKRLGYTIVTNVGGDEKPLEGTVGLLIPYIELIDFVNQAGAVISIRSGLCDIVSSTDSKMVVFFPEGNDVWPQYFSLRRMGLKTEGLLEARLGDMEAEQMIEWVIGFLTEEFRETNDEI